MLVVFYAYQFLNTDREKFMSQRQAVLAGLNADFAKTFGMLRKDRQKYIKNITYSTGFRMLYTYIYKKWYRNKLEFLLYYMLLLLKKNTITDSNYSLWCQTAFTLGRILP